MVESFTPRVGAATQDSKVGRSSAGQSRPPIKWGQGIPIRPSTNLPQPSDPSSHPSATLPISPASVSEAISRLQQEKTRLKKKLDQKQAEHDALTHNMVLLRNEKEFLSAENTRKQQLIKSLHQELAGEEAELDGDDDDQLLHRMRRDYEKRLKDCEERLNQSQADG